MFLLIVPVESWSVTAAVGLRAVLYSLRLGDEESTALWVGAVTTDRRGEAKVTFDMPENLTTWRVRAFRIQHGFRHRGIRIRQCRRTPVLRVEGPLEYGCLIRTASAGPSGSFGTHTRRIENARTQSCTENVVRPMTHPPRPEWDDWSVGSWALGNELRGEESLMDCPSPYANGEVCCHRIH